MIARRHAGGREATAPPTPRTPVVWGLFLLAASVPLALHPLVEYVLPMAPVVLILGAAHPFALVLGGVLLAGGVAGVLAAWAARLGASALRLAHRAAPGAAAVRLAAAADGIDAARAALAGTAPGRALRAAPGSFSLYGAGLLYAVTAHLALGMLAALAGLIRGLRAVGRTAAATRPDPGPGPRPGRDTAALLCFALLPPLAVFPTLLVYVGMPPFSGPDAEHRGLLSRGVLALPLVPACLAAFLACTAPRAARRAARGRRRTIARRAIVACAFIAPPAAALMLIPTEFRAILLAGTGLGLTIAVLSRGYASSEGLAFAATLAGVLLATLGVGRPDVSDEALVRASGAALAATLGLGVLLLRRAPDRPLALRRAGRVVSLGGLAAGLAAGAIGALDTRVAPVPTREMTLLKRHLEIYDVLLDPETHRLYWTSLHRPFLGYRDLETGRNRAWRGHELDHPERMQLSQPDRTLYIGGRSGTFRIDADLATPLRAVDPLPSADLVLAHGLLAIVHEAGSNMTLYDPVARRRWSVPIARFGACSRPLGDPGPGRVDYLKSFAELGHLLRGLCRWPYSVSYAPASRSVYVADYMLSPFVSVTSLDGGRNRTRWHGAFNVGSCVSSRRGELYLARPLHGRLDVLDAQSLELRHSLRVGSGIRELLCADADGLVIALDWFKGSAWVIDMDGPRVLEALTSAGRARSVAYDARSHTVYVGTIQGIFSHDLAPLVASTRREAVAAAPRLSSPSASRPGAGPAGGTESSSRPTRAAP